MEVTYYKDNGGKWRWRVVADNGKIVGASSQGFANRTLAKDNVEILQRALLVEVVD
jgi:uncharacterized protein YegP (UPF0339 family)